MINDFKDLEKLFKLCRKQGIYEMDFNGIKFKVGDLPVEKDYSTQEVANQLDGFPDGVLTPEQLAFYSSGGMPTDDPFLKGTAQ